MRHVLVRFLRPYRRQILLVVALLLAQSLANLYLPTLNADIIDNGIAKGDPHYIVVVGGLMLLVTLLMGAASVVAVYWGAKTRSWRSTGSAPRRSSPGPRTTSSRCRCSC